MSFAERLNLTEREFIIDCTVMKLATSNTMVATFYIGNWDSEKSVSRTITMLSDDARIPESIRDTFASNLEATEVTRNAIDREFEGKFEGMLHDYAC